MAVGDPLPTLPGWKAPIGRVRSYLDQNYTVRWARQGGSTTAPVDEDDVRPSGALTESYRQAVLGGEPTFPVS